MNPIVSPGNARPLTERRIRPAGKVQRSAREETQKGRGAKAPNALHAIVPVTRREPVSPETRRVPLPSVARIANLFTTYHESVLKNGDPELIEAIDALELLLRRLDYLRHVRASGRL